MAYFESSTFSLEKLLSHKVYFISDAHLGSTKLRRTEHEKEDALIDFLRAIRGRAEALYIVGDLFDFWFEYRSAVSSTSLRIVCELYALVQSGVRVLYIPGNHDLWPGTLYSEHLGIELPGDPVSIVCQGKRLHITHGDSLRKDVKFRLSRYVLKHRLAIALFRLLHPDIGHWLARKTSSYSEVRTKVGSPQTILQARDIYRAGAAEIIDRGVDIVICGHYHHLRKIQIGAGTLVILGDWMRYDSYAVLENGAISIHQWNTAPERYRDPLNEEGLSPESPDASPGSGPSTQ
ncbi:MAG: UDP-2,3-diacylglucosamine diphosphatase [bacterium]|nr:UDP-2,3-diacylglucosamine diphosphatase [bacterium]